MPVRFVVARPLRRLTLAAVAVLGLVRVDAAAPPDAFLDRALPDSVPSETRTVPTCGDDGSHRRIVVLGYRSFWEGVQLLGTLGGKPVRMPAELAEWPGERTEQGFGREVGAAPNTPTRTMFDALCQNLNLTWRYDADAIDLRPAWWCADTRLGKELINLLLGSRPAVPGTLKREFAPWPSLGRLRRDPWRLAFDALLSRPENFAQAGALRLCHDQHGLPEGELVDNLCAVRLAGADGRVCVLVLNGQEATVRPSIAGDVAYYLFDEDGRFLYGGVYAIMPHACEHIAEARVEAERVVTVVLGWRGWGDANTELHFVLQDGDLILQSSTSQGVERSVEETQRLLDAWQGGPLVERRCRFPAR